MPIYEAQCQTCRAVVSYYQTVAHCHDTPTCHDQKMQKVILHAPMGIVDIPAYVSPVTGKVINSRKQRHEDLVSTQSRPYEGRQQEEKEAARQRAYFEADSDKRLTVAAETALAQMAPEKRRILETGIT